MTIYLKCFRDIGMLSGYGPVLTSIDFIGFKSMNFITRVIEPKIRNITLRRKMPDQAHLRRKMSDFFPTDGSMVLQHNFQCDVIFPYQSFLNGRVDDFVNQMTQSADFQ